MTLKASSKNIPGLLGSGVAPPDIGHLVGIVLVPKGEEFSTDELALVEANWLAHINSVDSVRWRVFPLAWDIEPTKEDDTYATSSIGNVAFVRSGKLTMKYMVKVTPFVMSQLNTLNGVEWDIYNLTSGGFGTGTSVNGVKFQPFTLQSFRVEGETPPVGDENAIVPITFTYADPTEWNERPSFIQTLKDGTPDVWNFKDLKDPRAVTSLVDTPELTGFNIFLEGYDRVPFTDASLNDIVIEDTTTGALTAVTSLTESATVPGQYVAVATIAAGTYYIGMAPVGTALATQGFAGLRKDLILTEHVIS